MGGVIHAMRRRAAALHASAMAIETPDGWRFTAQELRLTRSAAAWQQAYAHLHYRGIAFDG
jgi:hypothetical protein